MWRAWGRPGLAGWTWRRPVRRGGGHPSSGRTGRDRRRRVNHRRVFLSMTRGSPGRIPDLRVRRLCLGSAGPQTVTKELVVLGHGLLGCQTIRPPGSCNHVVPDQYLPTGPVRGRRGRSGGAFKLLLVSRKLGTLIRASDGGAGGVSGPVHHSHSKPARASELVRPTNEPASSRQVASGETGHGAAVDRRLLCRSQMPGGQVSIREVGMSGGFCHIVLRLVETGYRAPFSAARTNPVTGSPPLTDSLSTRPEGSSPQSHGCGLLGAA